MPGEVDGSEEVDTDEEHFGGAVASDDEVYMCM
jgi:hypothetical protein